MRLLGLDVGTRTIGLAVCDAEGIVATPLRTLRRQGGERDLQAVAVAMHEVEAEGLVIGLPLAMSGGEGEAARRVRALGEALERRIGCPVHYQDERFTTVEAERVLLDADLSRRRRKQVIDHVAATLILQTFIDSRRADGQRGDGAGGPTGSGSR